jgi:hypothetical protein
LANLFSPPTLFYALADNVAQKLSMISLCAIGRLRRPELSRCVMDQAFESQLELLE